MHHFSSTVIHFLQFLIRVPCTIIQVILSTYLDITTIQDKIFSAPIFPFQCLKIKYFSTHHSLVNPKVEFSLSKIERALYSRKVNGFYIVTFIYFLFTILLRFFLYVAYPSLSFPLHQNLVMCYLHNKCIQRESLYQCLCTIAIFILYSKIDYLSKTESKLKTMFHNLTHCLHLCKFFSGLCGLRCANSVNFAFWSIQGD